MHRPCVLFTLLVAFAFKAAPALAAGDMFPPIDKLLGGVHPVTPGAARGAAEKDLRDSLAPARNALWLRAELRSGDWQRRRNAITLAGRPGRTESVPYLGAAVMELNEDPRVRVAAAMGLGRIRHPAGVRFLEQALGDPEVDVRFAAALALGGGYSGKVTPLIGRLSGDPSWWVRYAAAVSLGESRKAFVVDALATALANDPSWQVRLQAAKSLGVLGNDRGADSLAQALEDLDPGVRAAAAIALGEVGGSRSIERLKTALESATEPMERSLLTNSLKKALTKA